MQEYKKILISSITVIIAFLVMWTTQTQAAATLVGQWEFDGDFTASNDSNYNGNPSGSVTFVPGKVGQAASFDGGTAIGTYNTTIDYVDSQKTTPASDFNGGLSIMGWIKPEDQVSGYFLSHDESCCTTSAYGFGAEIASPGTIYLTLRDSSDRRMFGESPAGIVPAGIWSHVAITWNGSTSGGIKIYVNGQETTTNIWFLGTFSGLNGSFSLPLRIGSTHANSVNMIRGYVGSIDHISLWKGALSAEEVLADYNNTKNSASATLVAQWEFDGDFAATNDSNYNGNPSGTVTFVPGQVGQAASFDGGTGVGSYDTSIDKVDSVKLTSASEFNGGLSIMGWVKTDAFPGINEDIRGKVFLSHDQSCCGSQFMGFDFGIGSSGELIYWMNDYNDNRMWGKTASGTIALGGWAHVAVTWNGNPSGGIQLYLNGTPLSTTLNFLNTFAGLNSTGLLPVRIGASFARSDNVIRGFDGSIDHISLWKGALSAEAILADYNNTRNTAPVANAGLDQPARVGHMVTLDGSGSFDPDGDPLTYVWTFISKPNGSNATLNNPTSVNPTFMVDKTGQYIVRLTVHDGKVPSDVPGEVIISTVNVPPEAVICGSNLSARVGETVMVDGSCSYDLDLDPLTYRWELISAPPGIIVPQIYNGPTFSVAVNKAGTYEVHLVVNDGEEDSAPSIAIISTINTPPRACVQPVDEVHVGDVVILDGSCSNDLDEDLITYSWTFVSKPNCSNAELSNPTAVSPSFTVDKGGNYVVNLVVHDGKEPSEPASVTISTINVKPVADAGPDQLIIVIGTTVCLDGTQSYDPDCDNITYQWSFTSKPPGSNASLENADTPTPCFVADVRGDYIIQLTVTDPSGANSTDCVKVSFDNIKPVADAGTGGSVVVGKPFTLDGSGSSDANGDTLDYDWSFTSKPDGSQCLKPPAAMITTFVPDVVGSYVVKLVVNDRTIDSEPDQIQIQVVSKETPAIDANKKCIDQVALLDPGVFKNANMQNTMINKFNAVIANIEAGNYADALGQLQNDILKKTDGCANTDDPDKNDWITTCDAQGAVYPYILVAIGAVEALMQ